MICNASSNAPVFHESSEYSVYMVQESTTEKKSDEESESNIFLLDFCVYIMESMDKH